MMKTSRLNPTRFFALTLAFIMFFANIAFVSSLMANESGVDNVTIEKVLRMPIGTNTPAAIFKFEFEKIELDNDDSPAALAEMPDLNVGNMTVGFTTTDTGPLNTESNIISITKETSSIFAGVTFDRAGVYIYEITETKNTNPTIDSNKPDEVLTYSDAVYIIRIYVANNSTFTDTVIHTVNIFSRTLDEDGQVVERKVEQMTFVNDYVKTNTIIEPPIDQSKSTLGISKTVTGDLANTNLYFNFDIVINVHTLVALPHPAYYRAYVVENGAVVSNIANNAASELIGSDTIGPFIRISTSNVTRVNLKHGQRLAFVDTPVGTSYTAAEVAAEGYTTTFTVTTNAMQGAVTEGLATGIQFVGELANSADFTNNRTSVVPTGVNINDLPFIGLIALPILALIGFVVIKSRKRNHIS